MGDQKELLKRLQDVFKDQFAYVPSVEITLSHSTVNKETTFRSRSIIFIGMALLVAQTKNVPIVVPENGTVSLNYPLSPSRRSACSARTTHPTYMSKIRILWAKMGIHTHISNPYEFCTKGEMVSHCKNPKLLEQLVRLSNSCGKRGHRINWELPSATHCGLCMPCTYRRASLLSLNDTTIYGNTINKKWAGRRNTPFLLSNQGQDIAACLEFLRKPMSAKDIKDELLVGGVIDLLKIDDYVNVVLRTRDELRNLVNNIGDREVKKKAGII
jgi:7-cyano-7-deazaguanine synthase in queuosine biosynthesis